MSLCCSQNVLQLILPKQYPYDVVGGTREIFATDFDQRVDIIPVADPNIFSQTQRITIAQTELQMAMSNPQIHNFIMRIDICMKL